MQTGPVWCLVNDIRRLKVIDIPGYTRKVCVDSVIRPSYRAREHVANHETYRVVLSIFASDKPVDAFHHILSTEMRIRARYALAFDDRVRIVFLCPQEHLDEHQRYVGAPVR